MAILNAVATAWTNVAATKVAGVPATFNVTLAGGGNGLPHVDWYASDGAFGMPVSMAHTGAAGRRSDVIMHGVNELSALHTNAGICLFPVWGGQAATEGYAM